MGKGAASAANRCFAMALSLRSDAGVPWPS